MRVGLVRSVALGMVALVGFAGCDDNPTDFDTSDTASITTNPSAMVVNAGTTALLDSRTINAGDEPTWEEISATVDGSCGHSDITVATAATYEPSIQPPGQFDVTAGTTLGASCVQLSGGGADATVDVTVVGDSLAITNAPDTLNLNSSVQLGSVLLAATGDPVSPFDAATEVTWASDAPEIMTVDETGLVTAVGVGGAAITATWTGFGLERSSTVAISTNQPEIVITNPPDPPEVLFPTTVDLDADLINPTDPPADFGPFDQATDVIWTSSNPDALSVDESTGEVTAVGAGSATITATWSGNEDVFTELELTVTGPAPSLTSLDVTSGPVGTYVTITGTGMLSIHRVFVDGSAIPLFQDGDPTATTASFWMPNPGFAGAGTYDVQMGLAGDLSNALSFTLTAGNGATDPANDDPGAAPPAPAFPFTLVDYLDGADVDDFFAFSLAAETTIQFDMDWDSGADFDILITDGAFAAFACTAGATAGQPESAECVLPAGDYLLWLNSYDAAAGNYFLTAEIVP